MATTKKAKISTDVITPTKKASTKSSKVDFVQQVKQRAYYIYNERVKQNLPGDALHDWLKAENEVKSNYSHP